MKIHETCPCGATLEYTSGHPLDASNRQAAFQKVHETCRAVHQKRVFDGVGMTDEDWNGVGAMVSQSIRHALVHQDRLWYAAIAQEAPYIVSRVLARVSDGTAAKVVAQALSKRGKASREAGDPPPPPPPSTPAPPPDKVRHL